MKRLNRRRTGAAVAFAMTCASAGAMPVTNWVIDQTMPPAGQTLVTSGLDTNSPILGTTDPALPDNADASAFHSDFPAITLSDGDSILLTGTVTLTGITSSMRNFRFGLFDRNGSTDVNGWLGYFVANSVATATNSYGEIRQRNADNTELHVSVMGSTEIARTTNAGNFSTGAAFLDHPYRFDLQLTRDGANYDIRSALYNLDGTVYNDRLHVNDQIPATTESFTFNNVVFLLGGGLNTDKAEFRNIEVTYVPEPAASLGLCGGALLLLGRGRRQ